MHNELQLCLRRRCTSQDGAWLCISLLSLFLCTSCVMSHPVSGYPAVAQDDYVIYRLALRSGTVSEVPLAVMGTTLSHMQDEEWFENYVRYLEASGTDPRTIANMRAVDSEPRELRLDALNAPTPSVLAGQDVPPLGLEAQREFWARFSEHHGGANRLVALSRVGYNDSRTEALVFVVEYCGVACAGSQVLLFGRSGNTWKILVVGNSVS